MSSNVGNQPDDPTSILQQQLKQEQLQNQNTTDATTAGQVPLHPGQLLSEMNTAIAGMSSQDTISSASSAVDTTQFSSISQAYTAGFLNGVQSDSPDLAAFKNNFDPDQVSAQLSGNSVATWLDGSYMVTMADTSMQRGNMLKQQEFKQNMIAANFFTLIYQMGETLGALAKQQANLESQQYMFEAGMLFVGLGITVGAGALSLGGIGASRGAKMMGSSEEDGAAGSGAVTAGGTKSGAGSLGDDEEGPSSITGSSSKFGSLGKSSGTGSGEDGGIGGEDNESSKTGTNTENVNQNSDDQKSVILANARAKAGLDKEEGVGGDEEEGPGWQQGTIGGGKTDAEAKEDGFQNADEQAGGSTRSEAEAKEGGLFSKLFGRMTGSKKGANTAGSPPAASGSKTKQNLKTGGQFMKQMGMTGENAGGQVGNILDNIVKSIYAPLIGAVQQQTKIAEAEQQILYKALDGVMSGAKDAGDSFNTTMQDQKQMTDAQIQAFNLGRG